MASLTYLFYHIVLTPKYRRATLADRAVVNAIAEALAWIAEKRHAVIMAAEVGPEQNHLHLLVCLPPHVAVADWVRDAKSLSSRKIRVMKMNQGIWTPPHFWSAGFFARTVGGGDLKAAQRYVEQQWDKTPLRIPPRQGR